MINFVKEMNWNFAAFLNGIFGESGIGEAAKGWVDVFANFFEGVLSSIAKVFPF